MDHLPKTTAENNMGEDTKDRDQLFYAMGKSISIIYDYARHEYKTEADIYSEFIRLVPSQWTIDFERFKQLLDISYSCSLIGWTTNTNGDRMYKWHG